MDPERQRAERAKDSDRQAKRRLLRKVKETEDYNEIEADEQDDHLEGLFEQLSDVRDSKGISGTIIWVDLYQHKLTLIGAVVEYQVYKEDRLRTA
jgi:hypothetical protein